MSHIPMMYILQTMTHRIGHIAIVVAVLALTTCTARGMEPAIPDSLLDRPWAAYWIQVPGESPHAFGVYLFRKTFMLREVPSSFRIHVSADNRYKLFVNGRLVSLGPARGDVLHWRFESVDISGYLSPGKNVVAAVVWNDGDMAPLAQMSYRSGFILQGDSPVEAVLNTNGTWKCAKDEGYSQLLPAVIGYYAASPGECLDMKKHENGWEKVGYEDSSWLTAAEMFHGNPKGVFTFDPGWMLVPSPIPEMEMRTEHRMVVRESFGVDVRPGFLPRNSSSDNPGGHRCKAHSRSNVSHGRISHICFRWRRGGGDICQVRGSIVFSSRERHFLTGSIFQGEPK